MACWLLKRQNAKEEMSPLLSTYIYTNKMQSKLRRDARRKVHEEIMKGSHIYRTLIHGRRRGRHPA